MLIQNPRCTLVDIQTFCSCRFPSSKSKGKTAFASSFVLKSVLLVLLIARGRGCFSLFAVACWEWEAWSFTDKELGDVPEAEQTMASEASFEWLPQYQSVGDVPAFDDGSFTKISEWAEITSIGKYFLFWWLFHWFAGKKRKKKDQKQVELWSSLKKSEVILNEKSSVTSQAQLETSSSIYNISSGVV